MKKSPKKSPQKVAEKPVVPAASISIFSRHLPLALEVLGLIAVLGVTVLLYRPTLNGGWNFDDLPHIVNNPAMRLDSLAPSALAGALSGPLPNRPLAYLTFALDNFCAHGFEARDYHITNLAIHLAAVVVAWLFLRLLLAAPALAAPWPRAAALAVTAIFAVHPVQYQSAAYVVQRMNLLAGLFTLAALGLWLWGRGKTGPGRVAGLVGAGAAAALGLLGKETTASLALLLPAADLCLSGRPLPEWARKRKWWLSGLVVVSLAVGAALFIGGKGLSGYAQRDFTLVDRLLTQPRVILWYALVWLFPAPQFLSLEHNFPVSESLLSPITTLPALVIVLGLTALAVVRSGRAPLLCLGWLWFIGGLALESSFLPLEMVFEHRLYLPGIGLCLCAVDLVRRAGASRAQAVAVVAAIGVIAAASAVRARAWASDLDCWNDATSKAPTLSRPWSNLCAIWFGREENERAMGACLVATRMDADDAQAQFNLGLAFYNLDLFSPAEDAYSRALVSQPDWAEALYQRGRVRVHKLNFAAAEQDLLRATQLEPGDAVYWFELAVIRKGLENLEGARQALAEARRNLDNVEPELRPGLMEVIRQLEGQVDRAGAQPTPSP